ncbi:ABC transporter permease [Promicromonospora panici]|uniref:ABC transporter permease n=1 Tax=Promicromonospora panici TaxID=2219658 RepID=UPI003BF56FD1
MSHHSRRTETCGSLEGPEDSFRSVRRRHGRTTFGSAPPRRRELTIFGSIALLVGGTGAANPMIISVLERRREIGLRRSLGATPRDARGGAPALAPGCAASGRRGRRPDLPGRRC